MSSNLYDACVEYLEDQNCTLWGRAFDINDEKTLPEAAAWLERQVRKVVEIRQERGEALPTPGQQPLPFENWRHAREVVST